MRLFVNNEEHETTAQQLDGFLAEMNLETRRGIAIAVNNTIIARSVWSACNLQPNDKITIITATQGG